MYFTCDKWWTICHLYLWLRIYEQLRKSVYCDHCYYFYCGYDRSTCQRATMRLATSRQRAATCWTYSAVRPEASLIFPKWSTSWRKPTELESAGRRSQSDKLMWSDDDFTCCVCCVVSVLTQCVWVRVCVWLIVQSVTLTTLPVRCCICMLYYIQMFKEARVNNCNDHHGENTQKQPTK